MPECGNLNVPCYFLTMTAPQPHTCVDDGLLNVITPQQALSETFAELSQKSPELREEFKTNSETQRNLSRNGEMLLNALHFFLSSIHTLCDKTIEDTLTTVRQYEAAR